MCHRASGFTVGSRRSSPRRSLSIDATSSVCPRATAFSRACAHVLQGALAVSGRGRTRRRARTCSAASPSSSGVSVWRRWSIASWSFPCCAEDAAEVEVGRPEVRLALDGRPIVLARPPPAFPEVISRYARLLWASA